MIIKQGKKVSFTTTKHEILTKLENINYMLKFDDRIGEYYLEEQAPFKLPEKIYGNIDLYANRYLKKFNSRNKNLGILLTGLKGTGKSLLAKKVCIESNMPVIIITKGYSDTNFISFLNKIEQECIIFIDEFEKIYTGGDDYGISKGTQTTLLSILDGVFESKKLFLLTANDGNKGINNAFLNRPSRILYYKNYKSLEQSVIDEVINDLLENKNHKKDFDRILSVIGDVNMDLLVSLIEECNEFKETPTEAVNFLNINPSPSLYKIEWKEQAVYYNSDNEKLSKEVLFSTTNRCNPLDGKLNLYLDVDPIKFIDDTGEEQTIYSNKRKFKAEEYDYNVNNGVISFTKDDEKFTFTKTSYINYTF